MFKDIDEYCKSCVTCEKAGRKLTNTKNRIIESESEKDLWVIDLLGRIPDDKANKFIFVAVNHFTKWVETRVLENKSSKEIVKAIEELIIAKHGTPKEILADCELEFKNKEVEILCLKNKIILSFSSPHHHQTIGSVERVNQTFMHNLKKLCGFGKVNWTSMVEKATLAVNLAYHRALGTSPYMLKYGATFITEFDKTLGIMSRKVDKENLLEKKRLVFNKYKKQIVKGKITCKSDIKIGDKVFVYRPNTSNKLKPNWIGGYEVVNTIPPDAFLVRHCMKKCV
jgi:hypothetical protein